MDEDLESDTTHVEAGVPATPKPGEGGSPANADLAADTADTTGEDIDVPKDAKEGRSPDRPGGLETAAPCRGATTATRALNLNELQSLSSDELESLAREFD